MEDRVKEQTTLVIPEVASEEVFVVDFEVVMELKTEGTRDMEAATTVGVAMVMAMGVAMATGAMAIMRVEVVVALAAEASIGLEDLMADCKNPPVGVADEDGEVFVEGGEATKAYPSFSVH